MLAERAWNVYQGFRFDPEQQRQREPPSAAAHLFDQWTERLCQEVEARQEKQVIPEAKALLVDAFFEKWDAVPKQQRPRLLSIFDRAYHRILTVQQNMETMITVYATPVPPAPTKSPTPAEGVNVGVILEE